MTALPSPRGTRPMTAGFRSSLQTAHSQLSAETKATPGSFRQQQDSAQEDEQVAETIGGCYAQLGANEQTVHQLAVREKARKLRSLNDGPSSPRVLVCGRPFSAPLRSRDGVSAPGVLTYGEVPAAEALRLVAIACLLYTSPSPRD